MYQVSAHIIKPVQKFSPCFRAGGPAKRHCRWLADMAGFAHMGPLCWLGKERGARQWVPRQQPAPNCSCHGTESMAVAHGVTHQKSITKDCHSSFQLLPRPASLGRAGMLGV